MTALAPTFRSMDYIAGLNLNYRKCCWVQYGTEGRESLRTWISENCEEFREMQIVRHAKYVGTMVVPDGRLHRWTAPRKNFIQRALKINASTKTLVERLCDFKIYSISVLSFIGSVCAPDKATLKAENHALQCTTAGPYHAIPSNLLGVGSICSLGPDLVGTHSIRLADRYRFAACSTTLTQGLEKNSNGSWTQLHSSFRSLSHSFFHTWPLALRMHLILFGGWIAIAPLMKSHKTKSRKLQLACFWTNFTDKTLLGLFLVVPRES